jgi:anti-sigma factor RsiW
MRHPNQATLALQAGGDLGAFARWKTERHLAQCGQCRDEVAGFEAMRSSMADLFEMPELPWNRIAEEMRANIRLGLAAGECVRPVEKPGWTSLRAGWRMAVAMASIMALAVTGLVLERPRSALNPENATRDENAGVQTALDGIGNQTMKLMYRGAEGVQLSAGAEGSVQAQYTNPVTGYMTVSQVDVQ